MATAAHFVDDEWNVKRPKCPFLQLHLHPPASIVVAGLILKLHHCYHHPSQPQSPPLPSCATSSASVAVVGLIHSIRRRCPPQLPQPSHTPASACATATALASATIGPTERVAGGGDGEDAEVTEEDGSGIGDGD
uniref:Uncharacterized protein n=1 Tax=Oryza rufipogon TaxID=4529 RepID=A0A0E0NFS1_ORYRU